MRAFAAAIAACTVGGLLDPAWSIDIAASESKALAPGLYEISLTAKEGSRRGAVLKGDLVLVKTSPKDKSPRTGEVAKDAVMGRPELYGWTDINLKAVGAPVCSQSPHPPAASRDPVFPGIVVLRVPYGPNGPFSGREEVPAVLVGTLSNLRNDQRWLDGCGFAMYVLRREGRCRLGKWSEWGLLADGRGEFRLCEK